MLILPFAYHVNQFDAGRQRLCTAKRFKSQHRPYPAFDIAVILLNQVIQILTLPDGDAFLCGNVGIERCQSGGIGAAFINSHHLRFAVVTDGLTKETQRGGIPFGGQQKVYGLPHAVDGAV